jgi:hypothetical protein
MAGPERLRGAHGERDPSRPMGGVVISEKHEGRRGGFDHPLKPKPRRAGQSTHVFLGSPCKVQDDELEKTGPQKRRCAREALGHGPAPSKPEETPQVDTRRKGRGGIEAVRSVHPRPKGTPTGDSRHEREKKAGASRGTGAIDLGHLPSWKPAAEERIQSRDTRAQGIKPAFAAERRAFGLQASGPQEIFESGFEGRRHIRFFFASSCRTPSGPVKTDLSSIPLFTLRTGGPFKRVETVMDPTIWTEQRPSLRWWAALRIKENQCHEPERVRPERRIKPGVDGGLRAASWTARRTI